MTSVYIKTSALFRAYTREPGSDVMDEVFSRMESHQITGVISPFEHSGNPARDYQTKKSSGTIPKKKPRR